MRSTDFRPGRCLGGAVESSLGLIASISHPYPPAPARGVDQPRGAGGDSDLPLCSALASSLAPRVGVPGAREARSEGPGPTWARRWAP